MADTLTMISMISFILAGVFAAMAVALWFVFKIPSVVGDLSGRTARKSIEQMRQNNDKTGIKSYRTSNQNLERGKLTGTIENISRNRQEILETGLLKENRVHTYEPQETELLMHKGRQEGFCGKIQTASLTDEPMRVERKAASITIKSLGEVMYIHTEEEI